MKNPHSESALYISPTGRGVDVSSVRLDDLDKACLEKVKSLTKPTLLDIGCGVGGFSVAAAAAGASVTAVDQFDFTELLSTQKQIMFVQSEIHDLPSLLIGRQFDVVYSQRTWHYLPYQEALEALQYIRSITNSLYISVTGLQSEAGVRYAHAHRPVQERFSSLDPDIAEKLQMFEPVCLYSKEEFEELLKTAGFQIEKSWESAFGNIKVICN